jgi:catechol 2,3-dioxygenase-like lactoylglutathione lyase family enzyme
MRYITRSVKNMRHTFRTPRLLIALGLLAVQPSLAADALNPLHLRPHHLTARVWDIDRAARWYHDMLGFQIGRRGEHGDVKFAELSIPGFGIALIKEPSTGPRPAEPNAGVPRWLHIVFSVPNLDVAYRYLEAKGASLAARKSPDGHVQSFLITDSEGNEVEIIEDESP